MKLEYHLKLAKMYNVQLSHPVCMSDRAQAGDARLDSARSKLLCTDMFG